MSIAHGPTTETSGLSPDMVETAKKYMLYLDQVKDDGAMLSWLKVEASKNPPLVLHYIRELQSMIKEYSEERLLKIAKENATKLGVELKKIGLEPSSYANSISWTLWHAAKSRFLASEKGKEIQKGLPNAEKYHPYDPFADLKPNASAEQKTKAHGAQEEIRQSMLGWEVYNAFSPHTKGKGPGALSPFLKGTVPADINALLGSKPKQSHGTLSTYQLRDLGRSVLGAIK